MSQVYNRSEREAVEEQYWLNDEGSAIVESVYAVPEAGYLHVCVDNTWKYHQLHINHARSPNVALILWSVGSGG